MKRTDRDIAMSLGVWLQSKGCTVAIVHRTECIHVHYTLPLDTKPQPPVKVTREGHVVFPAGSQEDVIASFMSGE